MRNLPKGIHANFISQCHVCGAEITVRDGRVTPHECRIELEETL